MTPIAFRATHHCDLLKNTAPRHLRILSANLCGDRASSAAFAELLARNEVDVAVLQELTPGTADAVARVLPHGHLDPAVDSTGMGIAMRLKGGVRTVPLPYCNAQVTVLEPLHWGVLDQSLEVMNVHFSNPLRQPPWRTRAQRTKQCRLVEAWLADPRGPRVVVGDFNSSPRWPLYRRLARWSDDLMTTVAGRDGTRPEPTWSPVWSGRRRLLRIDHALAVGLNVRSARVVHVGGSDHSAILFSVDTAVASDI